MFVQLPLLNHRFLELDQFQMGRDYRYELLPLRFISLDDERYVVTNLVGEHAVLSKPTLLQFVRHELDTHSAAYDELKSKHFLVDAGSSVAIDLLAIKYRTKQALLANFTSLFIFVVTLRCDHSCPYCQVSRQSLNRLAYDMKVSDADRAIKFMFSSPSPSLKIEIQGGESLLNFDLIRHIVLRVMSINETARRDIQFVIATNLAFLTDEILHFCRDHGIYLSTSLDGPRSLHNENRPRPGHDSYELAVAGIERAREVVGWDQVSALMTTTELSLSRPQEIIDEYLKQGFSCIFLRPLSPFGFARKTGAIERYSIERWLEFYFAALRYIIDLNIAGTPFREEYASFILRKILTPYPTTYVDLQSPAGIGIGALVFNYDGAIYASDESRMLAETGDRRFQLGNLSTDSFESVMGSDRLLEVLNETMTEGMPMCSDCGFQPYCGSDPVFHYATQSDVVGHKPSSQFCQKNMSIMRHLILLLEDDPRAATVLKSWI